MTINQLFVAILTAGGRTYIKGFNTYESAAAYIQVTDGITAAEILPSHSAAVQAVKAWLAEIH